MADLKQYDVVVIGAGPAGMTAATYAARAELSVVMLDQGVYGGQMNNTAEVENYPGFDSVMGPDLSEKMYSSTTHAGAEYAFGTVESLEVVSDQEKIVHTDSGDFQAKAVIIATGSEHVHLGVPGEEEYQGRGISYCAVCDGAFFKNEDVAVIGGGDSAVEEGIYLANIAASVTIIVRSDQLKAQPVLQKRARENDKIKFIWNTSVQQINGNEEQVTDVDVINNQTQETGKLPFSGVFIYVGLRPNTEAFQDLGITDDQGWIVTDDHMKTAIPGVFAVGDVRQKNLRQIVTAVGDGGLAGQQAYDFISQI
ncbi:thioredoxin-disulfide reductase [Leuconostocaceae bacterium ESL0723]|nr:thioredoxin-disulfide reductase [Leuconostocaceae bacterium ESL0723]